MSSIINPVKKDKKNNAMDKAIACAKEQLEQRKGKLVEHITVKDIKIAKCQLNSIRKAKPVTESVKLTAEILKKIGNFYSIPSMLSPIRDIQKPAASWRIPKKNQENKQQIASESTKTSKDNGTFNTILPSLPRLNETKMPQVASRTCSNNLKNNQQEGHPRQSTKPSKDNETFKTILPSLPRLNETKMPQDSSRTCNNNLKNNQQEGHPRQSAKPSKDNETFNTILPSLPRLNETKNFYAFQPTLSPIIEVHKPFASRCIVHKKDLEDNQSEWHLEEALKSHIKKLNLSSLSELKKPPVTFLFPKRIPHESHSENQQDNFCFIAPMRSECISRKRKRDSYRDTELIRLMNTFESNIENLASGKYQPMNFPDFKEIDFTKQQIWETCRNEKSSTDDGSLKIKLRRTE